MSRITGVAWQVVVYNRADCCGDRLNNAVCFLHLAPAVAASMSADAAAFRAGCQAGQSAVWDDRHGSSSQHHRLWEQDRTSRENPAAGNQLPDSVRGGGLGISVQSVDAHAHVDAHVRLAASEHTCFTR